MNSRRTTRHYFGGPAEVIDIRSKRQLLAPATDLSLFGCFVKTIAPFAEGTRIRLRITHGGEVFEARGHVAHSRAGKGMGIALAEIELPHQVVLDEWLAQNRSREVEIHKSEFVDLS